MMGLVNQGFIIAEKVRKNDFAQNWDGNPDFIPHILAKYLEFPYLYSFEISVQGEWFLKEQDALIDRKLSDEDFLEWILEYYRIFSGQELGENYGKP